MVIKDVYPQCESDKFKKNGHIHNGKQNLQYHDCRRQFVDGFEQVFVSDETRGLIERLFLERLSLRGICRSVGEGLKWLLAFIVNQFEALPDHLNAQPITSNADVTIQRLEVEPDEMANFVQKKANKKWIWLAMDAYPGRVFYGEIKSISPGTGSAFSLLPPENATGNFVKVVQRIPVKIVLVHTGGSPSPVEALKIPWVALSQPTINLRYAVLESQPSEDDVLRPGMSAIATVDLRQTLLEALAAK